VSPIRNLAVCPECGGGKQYRVDWQNRVQRPYRVPRKVSSAAIAIADSTAATTIPSRASCFAKFVSQPSREGGGATAAD